MKSLAPAAVLLAFALSACAPVAATGFNGDSVTIQSPNRSVGEEVQNEASRICGSVDRRAEYASSTQAHAPQYMSGAWNHLFLCLA